jgi:hypothetical protein
VVDGKGNLFTDKKSSYLSIYKREMEQGKISICGWYYIIETGEIFNIWILILQISSAEIK